MARIVLEREKVYDPILRVIHAWNALAILLMLLSGRVGEALGYTPEVASLWRFHVWLGYGLTLGLLARLVWGLVGPEHARLSHLWHPRAWWRALLERRWFVASREWGHHPLASAVYLLAYALILGMVATGLALAAIDQGRGPLFLWLGHEVTWKSLFREPHEWMEYGLLAFVFLHVAALILHESRHGAPMAQSMVSGYQYRPSEKDEA